MRADGLLLDIDGVLAVSWEPLPGAVEAIARLRLDGVPFRLITNTTTHVREELAATLVSAGFDIAPNQIVTAVSATAAHLVSAHPRGRVFVLSDGEADDDLVGVDRVDRPEDADVIVIGGASDLFSYAIVNRIFRRLMDGAALVGMHRSLYWRTAEGLEIDGGAYLAGLEAATGSAAVVCGKPAAAFFHAALAEMGIEPARAAMVGDDIVSDVLGAQGAGLTGILVRTGKFREADLAKGSPDVVLDSLADVPAWLLGD